MTTGNEQTSPKEIDRSRLGTYLNDHLLGASVGTRLARRCANENSDNDFGPVLQKLAGEIEEDRNILKRIMELLELPQNPFKKVAGVVLEQAGTLKLNNRLLSYSPLSRLLELEGLLLGALGKRCLWQTLELVATNEPALAEFDFASLQERADRQMSQLGRLRIQARLPAFAQPRKTAMNYRGAERRSGQERRVRPTHVTGPERRTGTERRAGLEQSAFS